MKLLVIPTVEYESFDLNTCNGKKISVCGQRRCNNIFIEVEEGEHNPFITGKKIPEIEIGIYVLYGVFPIHEISNNELECSVDHFVNLFEKL